MKIQCTKPEWECLLSILLQEHSLCTSYNNGHFICETREMGERDSILFIEGKFDDKNYQDDYDQQEEEFCTERHTPSKEMRKFFENIEEAQEKIRKISVNLATFSFNQILTELDEIYQKLRKTFKVKNA